MPAKTPPPKNIPSPLPYGPTKPHFQMYMKRGKQVFVSRTNLNLVLTDDDFTDAGTFTMGTFLHSLPDCRAVHEQQVCPCLVAAANQFMSADEDIDPSLFSWHPRLDLEACPGIQRLIGFCSTRQQGQGPVAQAIFLERYLRALHASVENLPEALTEAAQQSSLMSLYSLNRALVLRAFHFPALVPEAWLNVVDRDDPTEEDIQHLSENPQRVDFALFARGYKAVIEIDGKTHYGFQKQGTGQWVASEQRYTKNLRIERSLRRQGWGIYRFSNLETRETPTEEYLDMLHSAAIPGIQLAQWVTPDDLALDDIPF
jgi:hypothetical protein